MNSNQIEGDSHSHSMFVRALLEEHNFEAAEHFVKTQMTKGVNFPKGRLWDSLIQALCVHQNDPEKALLVLRDCLRNNGILPSSYTFCSLIHAFSSRGMMARVIEVLELMNDEKLKYPFVNFVYSSIIAGFCKIGKPELAVGLYKNAESSGLLRPNLATYTALASALCDLGKFDEVSDLVWRMEQKGLLFDVVFYSNWIRGYFREGGLMDPFKKYREMIEKGISSDTISYTILIDGFSKEGNVEKVVGFLNNMRKDGLKPNLITYTAIMSGFCKKGKLGEAFTVLKLAEDSGIKADEFMYTTLIDGVCRGGDFNQVYHLLDDMEENGINPSIVTYNTLINGLCKVGRTSEADDIAKGIPGDIITYSTLLHGYIQEENAMGILETKRRVEEAGIHMDIVMCNILIKALFMLGAFEEAYAIYKGMSEMDLVADSVTFCTMIDGYCRACRIDEALEIFDDLRNTSISSLTCYRRIIYKLYQKGMVDMATEIFLELNEKGLALDFDTNKLLTAIFKEKGVDGVMNLVHRIENSGQEICDIIFNDAICFFCKRGFLEAACDVYLVMKRKGSSATCTSYHSILKGLFDNGKMWLCQLFLNSFVKKYGLVQPMVREILVHYLCKKDVIKALQFLCKMNKNTCTVTTFPVTVLKALTKDGRDLDAYKVVMGAEESLPVLDVVDYTILVQGLCKGGHLSEALDLCAFVKRKDITLNIVTYNSVINGLCRQGCLVEAFRLFDSLEKIDLVPSEITYASLIDTLCKEGYFLDAKRLLERMIFKGLRPNTHIYNSLIDNYCKFNQMEEAWKLLLDLESRCLKPDEFTLSSMINGYCKKGDLEGALKFFFEYKRKDLLPDFLGFMYLIKGLCAKGRMEEARSVLREMLQAQSVVEVINQVDSEVETESIGNFLVFLCEQGSIKEAITILNEVGFMFFPGGTKCGPYSRVHRPKRHYKGETLVTVDSRCLTSPCVMDLDFGSRNVKKVREIVENCDISQKKLQFLNFDSCYSLAASLCASGELQKANRLVKEMISNLDTGC
ncbi:pentatricopeptide repeat-containing protein At5g57250, mitochondrial isoform X2 [Malania oleifera]|nr:pentatricopeptide repeat-containing protein At5g57250, mitochondrial isoform X2 [Malania oleifera]